ncbi:uncharacterized protein [Haliotis cracherodii]|uniref:uncharacterized protein n=1 Tax=Haliotis cracherodii TaxID=6455 RepID=UPI0039EAF899
MGQSPVMGKRLFASIAVEPMRVPSAHLNLSKKQRLLDHKDMETSKENESMGEDEAMFEGSDDDSTSETEEEEEACCSTKLVPIQSFNLDSEERHVDVHVMVIGEPERKTDTKMKAVVADKTSAVNLWIYDDSLFKHFRDQAGVMLRNVRWNGRILEANKRSSAKVASGFKISDHIIAEALGTGQPISTERANALPDLSLMCLKGKVVKKSFLLIQPCYGNMKKLCQIKLRDDKGFVDVDVWGDDAEDMEVGIVIKMTSCRKREPQRPDGPPITTTPNTLVKRLSSSELKHINLDKLYRRGTIQAFDVDLESDITLDSEPNMMTRVDIDMLGRGGNLDTVMVFWAQLIQLFEIYNMPIPSIDDGENIKNLLQELQENEIIIRYKACGTVEKFRRC